METMWSPALNFCSSSVACLLCNSAKLSLSTPRTARWKPIGFLGSRRPKGRFSSFPLDSRIGRRQLRTTPSRTSLAEPSSVSISAVMPDFPFTEPMKSPLLSCCSGPAVSLYERMGPSSTSVTKSMARSCVSRPRPHVLKGSFRMVMFTCMGGPGGSSTPASLTLNRRKARTPRPGSFNRTSLLKPFFMNSELGRTTSPRGSDPLRSSSKTASSSPPPSSSHSQMLTCSFQSGSSESGITRVL
mmetsp:Transcript_108546/g.338369  ORF Transcript_108546/g.338369 Transcript_108546/m.338369 type:complete len:243 (+) Transcript_108546:153-881(+)